MDSALLKSMLTSQEQAYRSALEVVVNQFKDRVQALESTVVELRRSLEFTQAEVDVLKTERSNDKATIGKLTGECQVSTKLITELEERCNYLEDYSRRNNIHIAGMEEMQGGETWEQTADKVNKLLTDKLQLPGVQLERAHRVGQRQDHHPRPIVVRFSRYCDRETVMRNATKLRGTRIFLNDDLCPASQNVRRMQLPLLKKARDEGKLAYFRHTKLIIKERYGGPGGVGVPGGVRGRGSSPGEASRALNVPAQESGRSDQSDASTLRVTGGQSAAATTGDAPAQGQGNVNLRNRLKKGK